jgi:(2R)-3-sulfolactate dehydrogenase (NADP+)
MTICRVEELLALATRALEHAGAMPATARSAALALVAADQQGIASHGTSRVPLYAAHLRNARVDGKAIARIVNDRGGACLIDAGGGMAYPACELAIRELTGRAREFGIAYVGIGNSNHFGMSSYHLEALAAVGLIGIAFSNAPAAMPAAGGRRPLFGTNPVAAAFPRRRGDPLLIDLSLSQAARGKLMVAARDGEQIPLGWAVDVDGNPTTDPQAGLAGAMLPMGGSKGAMLAMMVELLCVALTGAAFAYDNDSFFSETGRPMNLGQGFLALDPAAFAGRDVFLARIEALIETLLAEPGVRLPGARRFTLQAAARAEGIPIPATLFRQLQSLASGVPS